MGSNAFAESAADTYSDTYGDQQVVAELFPVGSPGVASPASSSSNTTSWPSAQPRSPPRASTRYHAAAVPVSTLTLDKLNTPSVFQPAADTTRDFFTFTDSAMKTRSVHRVD